MNTKTREKAVSALSALPGKCAFCAHRKECKKTIGIMFGFCNTEYAPDLERLSAAVRLAKRVNDFSREWNTWDYRDALDAVGGVSAMITENADLLLSGDRSIEEWLEECIEEQTADSANGLDDYDYLTKKAERLLRAVRAFCADIN